MNIKKKFKEAEYNERKVKNELIEKDKRLDSLSRDIMEYDIRLSDLQQKCRSCIEKRNNQENLNVIEIKNNYEKILNSRKNNIKSLTDQRNNLNSIILTLKKRISELNEDNDRLSGLVVNADKIDFERKKELDNLKFEVEIYKNNKNLSNKQE